MMPFPGGFAETSNGLLLFSLVAAVLYGLMLDRPQSWQRTVAKTAAVFLIALIAIERDAPVLLIAALLLGSLGDAFLAHDGEKAFLGGLAAFLAAHIAYVALFVMSGNGLSYVAANPRRLFLAILLAVFCFALMRRLWPAIARELRIPVVVYMVAILGMGIAAATLERPAVMLGAVLFIVSDAILAREKFLLAPGSPELNWTRPAVWSLYYLAQLLIALGFLDAL